MVARNFCQASLQLEDDYFIEYFNFIIAEKKRGKLRKPDFYCQEYVISHLYHSDQTKYVYFNFAFNRKGITSVIRISEAD